MDNFQNFRTPSFLDELISFLEPYLKENAKTLTAIKTEVQNIKSSIDGSHEILTNKLGTLESLLDKIKDNTTQ